MYVLDFSPASHGGVSWSDGMQVLYVPSPEFVGTDQFTVTIQDARAKIATSRVVVTVVGNVEGRWSFQSEVVAGFEMVSVVEQLDALVRPASVFHRGAELAWLYDQLD